jgi:hypothetical protein
MVHARMPERTHQSLGKEEKLSSVQDMARGMHMFHTPVLLLYCMPVRDLMIHLQPQACHRYVQTTSTSITFSASF